MDKEVSHIAAAINVKDVRSMGLLRRHFCQSSNGILQIIGLTDPNAGSAFRRLFTANMLNNSRGREEEESLRNDQVFCLDDLFCKKNLLADWNTRSPSMAAMRLYCGVRALRIPVSNGEPLVMSPGYRVRSLSTSDFGALGRN